jgi:hypothetical protein
MSELIELAKEHLPIVRTFEKWVATGSPNRFGAVSGEYRTIFTIEDTSEQLEAFAKAYQADAPIDNVADKWKKLFELAYNAFDDIRREASASTIHSDLRYLAVKAQEDLMNLRALIPQSSGEKSE